MPIYLENRRKKLTTIEKAHPNAVILDVTSRGVSPWVKFSPFYPHGNIPVPLSPRYTAMSVEGIWQGLKVFERMDIDLSKFYITSMKGIKRSTRSYGNVLGHRAGVDGSDLLSYRDARDAIYLPAYRWILNNCVQDELEELRQLTQETTVILLDYETNTDVENLEKPLSHAGLIIQSVEGQWPNSKNRAT